MTSRRSLTADPASFLTRLISSQQYRSHYILHSASPKDSVIIVLTQLSHSIPQSASPRDALTADPVSVLTRLLSSHQYRSHSISNQHDLETLSHCRSCLFSDSVNIESAISITFDSSFSITSRRSHCRSCLCSDSVIIESAILITFKSSFNIA
uniref:Uncharacterized protein n=1 Tax=Cacopsylla melanoneura TaxID=428564 RepID=A0A8D8PTJ8_9HEMI